MNSEIGISSLARNVERLSMSFSQTTTSHSESLRIAYVLNGMRTVARDQPPPLAEYEVFLMAYGAEAISLDGIDQTVGWFNRLAGRLRKPHVALALSAAKKHRQIDAYLVSGEDIGWVLALALSARRAKSEVLVITHGSYFGSPKFRLLMIVLTSLKHLSFLPLSTSLRTFMVSKLNANPTRTINCGYGVDVSYFRPLNNSALSPPLIVSAGIANRDYESLITAIEGLDVRLHIAADSRWFPNSFRLQVSELPTNVTIQSAGDYDALRTLYLNASIIVVPLHEALFACGYAVAIECMAMGKVVIMSRTLSPPDFIVHGVTGFFTAVSDPQALRTLLASLLDDPVMIAKVGNAARLAVEEEYSLEKYAERLYGAVAKRQTVQLS